MCHKNKSLKGAAPKGTYCPHCLAQPLRIVNDHDTGWKRCAYCWAEIEKNDWVPPEEYSDFD